MPKIITNFGIDKLQILLTRCIYLFRIILTISVNIINPLVFVLETQCSM